jgi:hypothetical protein
MVKAGAAKAVMGNHELNAIAYHTPHPNRHGEFLRPHAHPLHGDKNRRQHLSFLKEFEGDPDEYRNWIEWFMELPLWLELPEIRVVHACWHPGYIEWLRPKLTEATQLKREMLEAATCKPHGHAFHSEVPSIFTAVEVLLKGLEVPLPAPHSFLDKDGTERREVRVRWWDPNATTYDRAAVLNGLSGKPLPDLPIPAYARISPLTDKPVFFGHYWFSGKPEICTPHAACVDYSAGAGGKLVAYRWDGESRLHSKNFVSHLD